MKLSETTKSIILDCICYLYIVLFVYAAASKLLDFDTFQNQLGQSPLLSANANWIAWLVPLSEILIAFLLIFNRFRILGLYGFYIWMVMFTTYIIIILNFTSFVPCSCGGVLEKLGWTEHLIFNFVFVVLSGISIVFYSCNTTIKPKKVLLKLLLLAFLSSMAVIVLFLNSEKLIKQNNGFIRRYMPHPVEKIGEYDLKFNSYYIAGMDDTAIYLGNYKAPLLIVTLDSSLTKVQEFRVSLDSMYLPYRRARIVVKPPHFFLGDGTIPAVFSGKIKEWKGKLFSYNDAFFTEFIVADSLRLGITTISKATRYKSLGLLQKTNDSLHVKLQDNLLSGPIHSGSFDGDGVLLWNEKHQQFIYTYFYQNSYEVTDKDMLYQFTGRTIDTISKPILDVVHYTTTDRFKLGGKSILVNRQSSTYDDYLYIHSDRLGRYEDEVVLRSASIIDVYNITDNTYAFSFYLYHQPEKKISDFKIYKGLLLVLVDNRLWLYRLKPEHFNSGSNAKHTAQFQEQGRTPVEKSRSLIK